MGGGICIVKACEDVRIKALATWASIGECKTPWTNWSAERMKQWQSDGVAYIMNSRTKQNMPLNYQLAENYFSNAERLDIKKAFSHLQIPVLLCHGTSDEAVPVETAFELQACNQSAEIFIVDSDHVFGRKHPATEEALPKAMQQVVDRTIRFFEQNS
jgi:pimeloyl-ACP methyl ester carboxylesterase